MYAKAWGIDMAQAAKEHAEDALIQEAVTLRHHYGIEEPYAYLAEIITDITTKLEQGEQ